MKAIWTRLASLLRWLSPVLSLAAIVGAGASGIYWHLNDTPQWISYPIRVVLFIAGVVLFFVHVRRWALKHDSAFVIDNNNEISLEIFESLSGERAKVALRESYDELAKRLQFSGKDGKALTELLIAPRAHRRRTRERVKLGRRSVHHEVTVYIRDVSPIGKKKNVFLLPVTRPEKGFTYENMSLYSDAGLPMDALTSKQSQALLFELARVNIVSAMPTTTLNATIDGILDKVVEVIISSNSELKKAKEIFASVTGTDVSGDLSPQRKTLWGILSVAATRRPIIAIAENKKQADIVITMKYVETLQSIDELSIKEDFWRKRLRKLRSKIGLPPTLVAIACFRARSCARYRMTFTAPPGMYVHEARAFSRGMSKWLPADLHREGLYTAFAGWTRPKGRDEVSFGTRSLHAIDGIHEPYFCVRICERLPGTVAGALLVALATTIVTWLCGAVPTGGKSNVDMVALALALPGVLAVWFGFTSQSGSHAFRAMSSLVSLGVSAVISIVSITVYMSISSSRLQWAPWADHGESMFLVTSKWWTVLLAISMCNLAYITGSLTISIVRYTKLL